MTFALLYGFVELHEPGGAGSSRRGSGVVMGAHSALMNYRIWGGFLAFGICAVFGVRLVWRGIRGDVNDASGTPVAGRGWFIIGGIACLLPLVGYFTFVWKQGYFG